MQTVRRTLSVVAIVLLSFAACGGEKESRDTTLPSKDLITPSNEEPDPAITFAKERLSTMTPREKVGQLMMVGYFTSLGRGDDALSEEEQARKRLVGAEELISEYAIGNFIIFAGQNFSNKTNPPYPYDNLPEFISAQTRTLQSFAAGRENPIPLLISIDQEGGGVPLNRVRRGVAELPSPMSLGAVYEATGSADYAYNVGSINGRWMAAMGINVILGPLLDLASQPEYAGMETRPFCADPLSAYELGSAYVSGVTEGSGGGVICCVKHFPGHGSTRYNADYNIYTSKDTLDGLKSGRLSPFIGIAAEEETGRPAAMMPCQMSLSFSSSPGLPITIDKGAMRVIYNSSPELRGWKDDGGLFITDDFGVRGIKNWMKSKGYPWTPKSVTERLVIPAIIAGNDIILLCSMEGGGYGHYGMVKGVLLELEKRYIAGEDDPDDEFCHAVDERCKAVLAAKARLYPDYVFGPLLADFEDRRETVKAAIAEKGDEDAALVAEVADGALTIAVNDLELNAGIVPGDKVALVSPRKWELKASGELRDIFEESGEADFAEYSYSSVFAGSIPRETDWIVVAASTLYSADRATLRSLLQTLDTSYPDSYLVMIDGGYPVMMKETVALPDAYVITFGHTREAFAGAARWLCNEEITPPPGKSPIPKVWR